MYKINVISSFPGAHQLNGYPGACKNLHGHNWKVRVQLLEEKTDELGMAIDFKVVKEKLQALIDKFDHQYLNELEWFKEQNPTSENIARVIYEELKKAFENENIKMGEVEVWESEITSVIYDTNR
jgi:6-pyruvoyltetrahydropterin/6-carboxytetrahydropterin synthase